MAAGQRVARWLSHTRFVPTPLYRLMLAAAMISSLLQLAYGAPAAVAETSRSELFDWAMVGVQLAAAITAVIGLYLVEGNTPTPWSDRPPTTEGPDIDPEKLHRSLTVELLGLIGLQTCVAIQLFSYFASAGRVPSALSVWMMAMFWAWSFFRDRDILRALRKLTR
jgi:hypothetical protein